MKQLEHRAVEDGRTRGQLRDRRRDVGEAPGVLDAVTAHQTDTRAVLVRDDPPAVDLLIVDPPVAVQRLADERGGHRGELRKHEP